MTRSEIRLKPRRFVVPVGLRLKTEAIEAAVLATALLALLCVSARAQQIRDYTRYVNPFIGTGGHGHTFPGAVVPFGMVQLSPDTRGADWDGSSGYHYSDDVIYGFSHTHLSGTGIPDPRSRCTGDAASYPGMRRIPCRALRTPLPWPGRPVRHAAC